MLRVVISGASSGLGAALARHYAARGATLALIARRSELLQQLVRELPCAIPYSADVRDGVALKAAAEDFMARHGPPDIVIANAGVSTGTLTEYAEDIERFQAVMDINVMGMVKTFHPFLGAMKTARKGALVGIASVAGVRGLPGAGAYCASKAAAISYLESLRLELRGSGVDVITVRPGYIATPMTEANPYPMPFMLSAERAAQKIACAVERRRRLVTIPWQMAVAARLLRLLPIPVYDALFGAAPRKPRRGLD